MKPNFEAMTKDELRTYVRQNRNDIEAIRVLFRVPAGQAVQTYPAMFTPEGTPISENIRVAEEAIRQRIEESDRRQQGDDRAGNETDTSENKS